MQQDGYLEVSTRIEYKFFNIYYHVAGKKDSTMSCLTLSSNLYLINLGLGLGWSIKWRESCSCAVEQRACRSINYC